MEQKQLRRKVERTAQEVKRSFVLTKTMNKNNTINLTRFSPCQKNLSSTLFCSAKQTPEIQESTVIPEEYESTPTQNQTEGRNNVTDNHQNSFMVLSGAIGKSYIKGVLMLIT